MNEILIEDEERNILIEDEKNIIDLTDDLPCGTTTVSSKAVRKTTHSRPITARRRNSINSYVVIIEDEAPNNVTPIPEVACHFFYPTEEEGEVGGGGDSLDPLAPIPEWVECSKQVTGNSDPIALETSLDDNSTPLAFVDPLGISIKSDPDAEIDIKPSLDELPERAQAKEMIECSGIKNFSGKDKTTINIKESVNNVHDTIVTSNKRKSYDDMNMTNNLPPKKLKSSRKVGPKCAAFRQKDLKQNKTSSSNTNQSKDCDLPLKKSNCYNKIGPKCAKLKNKEENFSGPCANKRKSYDDMNMTNNLPPKKLKSSRKVGPKCAAFRQKDLKQNKISSSNTNQSKDCDLPLKKSNCYNKIGPKCAKLKNKEENFSGPCVKDEMAFQKSIETDKKTDKKYAIKQPVVTIGPKLPLPQCFQPNNSSLQENILNSKEHVDFDDQLDDVLDNDHIVLKIYTCFKCNHKCTDPLFHEEHVLQCNNRVRSCKSSENSFKIEYYRCEICAFKFQNFENLRDHMDKHKVKEFICHICQQNFPSIDQLYQHNLDEHQNMVKVFSCNICDYYSTNIHSLKQHMVKHNPDKHLYCSSCKKNFEDAKDVEKHKEIIHKKSKEKIIKQSRTEPLDNNDGGSINSLKDKKVIKNKQQSLVRKAMKINDETSSKNCLSTDNPDYAPSAVAKFEAQYIGQQNGYYHCNGCRYKFLNLENLIKHKKFHVDNKPFSCCDGSFVSFSFIDFSKHVQEKHSKSFRLNCSMCSFTFKGSHTLAEHMVKHVNDGLYCYQCRTNLENDEDYRSHMQKTHACKSVTTYTCRECSFSTPFSQGFKRHMGRHKKSRVQSSHKKVPSKYDNQKANKLNRNELKSEKEMESVVSCTKQLTPHLKGSTFSCPVCSCKFSSPDALEEHMKTKHEEQQPRKKGHSVQIVNGTLRCNKCTFKSSQLSSFIRHVKNGHKKPKFICNVCRSDFTYLKLFLSHMENHAACAVVYSCNECRFTSKKRQIFMRHIRTHLFKFCPLCDYKNLRFSHLISHLQAIHTVDNEHTLPISSSQNLIDTPDGISKGEIAETFNSTSEDYIEKPHACCFCNFKTSDINSLRRHISVHFNKDTDSKAENLGNEDSKPYVPVRRLKSKISLLKKGQRCNPKLLTGNVISNFTPLYCCTKCDYKKKYRKSVSVHVACVHNIKGSIREKTIKKMLVKETPTNELVKVTPKNELVKVTPKNELVKVTPKNELVKVTPKNELVKVTPTNGSDAKTCPSCDMEKLSLVAQLQHRKYGHTGFWSKAFPCKICGFRGTNKGNLAKHLVWKHKGKWCQTSSEGEKKVNVNRINKQNVNRMVESNVSDSKKHHLIQKTYKKKMKAYISKCQECCIEDLSKAAQLQHTKLGHDVFWERSFSCNICHMRFPNNGSLIQHKSVHNQKFSRAKGYRSKSLKLKEYDKQNCKEQKEFVFNSKATSLDSSESSQVLGYKTRDVCSDEEDNYACGECDFVTSNVIEFSTHMFIHSGIPDD